jgi:hypothetical protein
VNFVSTESVGQLIAQTLAGCWRKPPPPLEIAADELSSITSHLISAGVAGLAWRRVCTSNLKDTNTTAELRRQYESSAVLAVLRRQEIESLIRTLESAGIKPLLVKGWAAARLYPDEGLRPYVDVDICVGREQLALAQATLKALPPTALTVDLHCEFETLGGGSWDEVYTRAQVITLGETEVRVPRAEDHLRIISIHLLREGAWRPLWLCDVAAAVESRPSNFDWAICFGAARRTSNWIECTLKLAHELLGADVSDTPAVDLKRLPRWLTRTVLKEWATPAPSMTLRHHTPMETHLRSPATLVSGIRNRWPNPIEGTVVSHGSFNDFPRFPFQLSAYMLRGARFAVGRPKRRRER